MNSVDLVLSAMDATGPAINSAINSFDLLGASVRGVGGDMQATLAQQFDASLFTNPLAEIADAAAIASAAIAGLTLTVSAFSLIGPTVFAATGAAAAWLSAQFTGMGEAVAQTFHSILEGTFDWGGMFHDTAENIITGFAIVEHTVKNLGLVWDFLATGIALRAEEIGNEVAYVFGTVIPTWGNYLIENVKEVSEYVLGYIFNVLGNVHKNLVNFSAGVMSWLHGDGWDFQWTALTEGFEHSLKDLPVIAERVIGEREGQLSESYANLGQQIGEAFTTGMSKTIVDRVGHLPELIHDSKAGFASAKQFLTALFPNLDFASLLSGGLGFAGAGAGGRGGSTSLPSLANERFTTGVGAAGREDMMLSELRETKTAIQKIAESVAKGNLGNVISTAVKEGMKAIGEFAGIRFGGR